MTSRNPDGGSSARLPSGLTAIACMLMALMVGGGLYESVVVDPAWPGNLALIQPDAGGIDRKLFWIPLHVATTILLPVALWLGWRDWMARLALLAALACYVIVRIWSALYFIPAALEYEAAGSVVSAAGAATWIRLSAVRTVLTASAAALLLIAALRLSSPADPEHARAA